MLRTQLTMGVLIATALASSAAMGNNKWTGNGPTNLWNDADNWQKGVPTLDDPVPLFKPAEDIEALIDETHVGDQEAIGGEVRVAYNCTGKVTLTVDGGTLRCTDRLFLAARAGDRGVVVIDAGQIIAPRITVGRVGDGTLIVNGGQVDCSAGNLELGSADGHGTLIVNAGEVKAVGFTGSGAGRIELNGGTLEAGTLNLTSSLTLEIKAGTLILAGDQTILVEDYAQAGFITTFEQHGSRGGLVVRYDADLDQTRVSADAAQMDLYKAWGPSPSGEGAPVDSALAWKAGGYTLLAQGHDVYFGTDAAAVEAATVDDPMGVYRGRQDANSYDPGPLALGRAYYWRVDQIREDTGDVHKGNVWSFTAQATWMIDDFDEYADWEAVLQVWEEQGSAFNWVSTAFAAAGNSLGVDLKPEQGLNGTMVMQRDMDLTAYGVRALGFDFASDPNQGFVKEIYVELSDATNTARVTVDDPVIVRNRAWGLVDVDLAQFVGIDLAQVKSLALGVNLTSAGAQRVTVYFDQLRLFPQRCIPERTLAGDLNGDCTVDAEDLAILTDRWLESTIQVVAAEPSSQPATWHRFDEPNNWTLGFDDEMGLANATPSAGATLDSQGGYDGLGAVVFTGTHSYLELDDAVFSGMAGPALTISLWVYGDPAFQPFANDAVFHGMGAGGFTMQFMCPDSQGRVVFDHGIAPADRVVWGETDPADWEGQWNHYAVVKDATLGVQQIYHNGRLVAETTSAFQSTPESGGMRIGATDQPTPQRLYHGKVDDFRIYPAVLPQAAILHLAGGTQIDQAPVTPADINGDGIVDQADRDILEANMGKMQLWP